VRQSWRSLAIGDAIKIQRHSTWPLTMRTRVLAAFDVRSCGPEDPIPAEQVPERPGRQILADRSRACR
jgi:hypothetical protein